MKTRFWITVGVAVLACVAAFATGPDPTTALVALNQAKTDEAKARAMLDATELSWQLAREAEVSARFAYLASRTLWEQSVDATAAAGTTYEQAILALPVAALPASTPAAPTTPVTTPATPVATTPTTPAASPVTAPSGALVLQIGIDATATGNATPAPENVDTRQPRPSAPEAAGGPTASIAWPGGSFSPQWRNGNGTAQILEASVNGGPWVRTRSGVAWLDSATDGTFLVRVVRVPADGSTIPQPTITLTRTTVGGAVTWVQQ